MTPSTMATASRAPIIQAQRPLAPPGSQGSSASDVDRAFLQRRVGMFGLMVGCLFGAFLAFRVVAHVAQGNLHEIGDETFVFHLAAAASFVLVWVLCRSTPRSPGAVRAIETIGLLTGTGFVLVMGAHIPLFARPDYILIVSLSLSLTARAVYVPSTARRSLIVAVAIGIGLVATIYTTFLSIDPTAWANVDPIFRTATPQGVALNISVNAAAWWTLTTVTTTAASHVIFGLRREVKQARQLGQYRLESKIGEGGMGMVFRATHAMLRRPTAVKLLLPEKAGEENLLRFEKEVQLTATLTHPNTVTVFDYGRTPQGVLYYAMEYIDGVTLDDVVNHAGPLPASRAVHIIRQICAALVQAHGIGLTHRDIKPANVMIFLPHSHGGVADHAKLLDFGLVKEMSTNGEVALTKDGSISGTPQYMSPEAITAPASVDARSDLYAVGAVAYYLVTGTHVFGGKSVVEVCAQHLHTEPEPLSDRLGTDVLPTLELLVLSCLSKEPSDRPQSALALWKALSALDVEPWSPEEAAAWWQDNGPTLSHRTPPSSGEAAGASIPGVDETMLDVARITSRAPSELR